MDLPEKYKLISQIQPSKISGFTNFGLLQVYTTRTDTFIGFSSMLIKCVQHEYDQLQVGAGQLLQGELYAVFSKAKGNDTKNKSSLCKLNKESFVYEHIMDCQHARNNEKACPAIGATQTSLLIMDADMKVKVINPTTMQIIKTIDHKTHGIQSWNGKSVLLTFSDTAAYLSNELSLIELPEIKYANPYEQPDLVYVNRQNDVLLKLDQLQDGKQLGNRDQKPKFSIIGIVKSEVPSQATIRDYANTLLFHNQGVQSVEKEAQLLLLFAPFFVDEHIFKDQDVLAFFIKQLQQINSVSSILLIESLRDAFPNISDDLIQNSDDKVITEAVELFQPLTNSLAASQVQGNVPGLGVLQMQLTSQKQYLTFNGLVIKELKHNYVATPMYTTVRHGDQFLLQFRYKEDQKSGYNGFVGVLNKETLRFQKVIDCSVNSDNIRLASDGNLIYLANKEKGKDPKLSSYDDNLKLVKQYEINDIDTLQQFCDYIHVGIPGQPCRFLVNGQLQTSMSYKYSTQYYEEGVVKIHPTTGADVYTFNVISDGLPVITGVKEEIQHFAFHGLSYFSESDAMLDTKFLDYIESYSDQGRKEASFLKKWRNANLNKVLKKPTDLVSLTQDLLEVGGFTAAILLKAIKKADQAFKKLLPIEILQKIEDL